jgi:serine/threonine protein kinase
LPQTRNVIGLEQRVPEMTNEELDFVKGCLAINPDQRMTAKQLLDHPYLSIKNSEILR